MTKFLLGKCCFFVNLRAGCLILAYLSLIINIIEVIMPTIVIVQITIYMLDRPYYPRSLEMFAPVLALNGIGALFSCCSLIFSVILLIGLHKHKPRLVKAFLINAVVFLVLLVLLLVAVAILTRFNLISVLTRIALLLFNVYMVIVIRSYYYRMPVSTGAAETTAKTTAQTTAESP